jgi:hypothetical protein
VRAMARRAEPLTFSRPGLIAAGVSAVAVGLLLALL